MTDDAVERAARAVYERIESHWPNAFDGCASNDTECDSGEDCATDVARAALDAARAGEAAHDGPTYEQVWQAITGSDEPWGGCADREAVERVMALILPGAAQRGGKAVDREALIERVQDAFDGCIDATAERIVVDLILVDRVGRGD